MDPARWNRIEELLQSALDREPDQRAAFLSSACGDDHDLRREVESLLAEEFNPALSQHPSMTAFQWRDLTGQKVSHYRIERRIGAGGMGEVYEARDDSLQRVVALKVLPAEFVDDTDRVRRFEQEALSASRLNHPNIITIFEILEADAVRFIATERIDGQTLRALLTDPVTKAGRRLEIDKALDIAIQVAAALKAAHTAWIIHRDIKPENVMVRGDGLVKVLDFGIAKLNENVAQTLLSADGEQTLLSADGEQTLLSADGQQARLPVPDPQTRLSALHGVSPPRDLTIPGAILGTASYMSPEQARGEPLDGRTDLFSLGLVLHEMVTGQRLLGTSKPGGGELLASRARLENVPREIERIIRKLLRTDRNDRYSSAGDLLDDLHRARRHMESRTARRMVGFGVLAVVVAMLVAGIAAFLSVNEQWEERVLRDGHTAAARQAVFSPDGKLVVSCGEDGQVIVWNFARRERIATLTNHPAHKIAYAPDGRWLATGGVDGDVVVWDTRKWTRVARLDAGDAEVGALDFSPDSRLLGISSPTRAAIWKTADWQELTDWNETGTTHGTFLFAPAGDHAIVSSNHLTVLELDGRSSIMGPQTVSLNSIAMSPDRSVIAGIDSLGKVRFHRLPVPGDLHRVELLSVHPGHQDHGRSVSYSPDGSLVASGADDILLWDAATQRKVARFEYPSIVWSVRFSPDGRWLLSTHGDGAVLVWDVAERERVASFNEHSGGVRAVAFTSNGQRIASGSEDRTVNIWDLTTGRKTAVLTGHGTRVMGIAFTKSDSEVVSVDQDGVIKLWDVAQRRAKASFVRPSDQQSSYCLAVSPDGRYFATTATILERNGRFLFDVWKKVPGQVYGMDFSDDGRLLAGASTLGDVILWDARTFRRLAIRGVRETRQITVSFSPDGKYVATGEDQGAIRLWRTEPLEHIAILGRHAARVKSVAFSPDGRTVASAGDDKMIALWDVDRRELRARIGTHVSPVYALAFSPDGRRLASGEHDRSVRVYTRRRTLWGIELE